MRLKICLLAFFLLVLNTHVSCSAEPSPANSSLMTLLRTNHPDYLSDRGKMMNALKSQKDPLTAQELQAVKELTLATDHHDWLLHYTAIGLLRANGADGPADTERIAAVKRLFIRMDESKWSSEDVERFYAHAGQIADVGNEVIPTLEEILHSDSPYDGLRKQVAVRALARMNGDQADPILLRVISEEKYIGVCEDACLALLSHKNDAATIDAVASAIAGRKEFDQESLISFISRSVLPERAKMRLFSHYALFEKYGKYKVIQGLAQIDSPESFRQLADILSKSDRDTFRIAAGAMGKLKNSDPCPTLLKAFPSAPLDALDELMIVLGERSYKPFIPTLEERVRVEQSKFPDDVTFRRFHVVAAGVLCRLGKDYDSNAAIVRSSLKEKMLSYNGYEVVAWLTDKVTIDLVASQITATQPDEHTGDLAIEALGKMGSKAAVQPLMNSLASIPYRSWRIVSEALAAIGQKQKDLEVTNEAKELKSLMTYVGRGLDQVAGRRVQLLGGQAFPAPEVDPDLAPGAAFLKKNPQLISGIVEAPETEYIVYLPSILEAAWTPNATPYLEKVMETNTAKVQLLTRSGANLMHYSLRSDIADLLTKKTGKQYTYVDADGTVRKGGVPLL
jgi:hypothetical protein